MVRVGAESLFCVLGSSRKATEYTHSEFTLDAGSFGEKKLLLRFTIQQDWKKDKFGP